jgi:F0F1-type ATP synthase membrane subunit b/b'
MMNAAGVAFWLFYGFFMLIALVIWVVWVFYSIKFFKKAAEYYQNELDRVSKKDVQMQELLAKFDQLVDVLKVK